MAKDNKQTNQLKKDETNKKTPSDQNVAAKTPKNPAHAGQGQQLKK